MDKQHDSPSGEQPLDEHEAQGERAPMEPGEEYISVDQSGASAEDAQQATEGEAAEDPFNPRLAWVTCGDRSGTIQGSLSLDEVERFICEDLQDPTGRYRELLEASDPGAKKFKAGAFRGVVVGGEIPDNRRRKGAFPTLHSELVQFDLDLKELGIMNKVEEAPGLRDRTAQHDAVALAFVSPSFGVKALLRVTPVPTIPEEHHAAYEAGTRALCEYLDIPFQEADPMVKAANGLCFLCNDPDVRRNLHPGAVPWEMPKKEPKPAAQGRKRSRGSKRTAAEPPGDAGDFLEAGVVDEAIKFLRPSDDYGQWLAELAWLKALGLSQEEVEAWSSRGAKYGPGEVLQRWDGLPADPREEAGKKLWAAAKAQGWTPPGGTGVSVSVSPEFLEELAEDHKKKRHLWISPDPHAAAYRYCRQFAADTLVVLPQEAQAAAKMGRRRFVRALLLDRSTGLWSEADAEIDRRHAAIMDQAVDHAYLLVKEDLIPFKQLPGIAQRLNDARTPAAADAMIQALPGVAKDLPEDCRLRVCRLDELDARPGYLPAENGLVDLRNGRLVPVSEAQDLLFQARPGTPRFVPDARHPIIDTLLSHLDPEKQEFIWNWCGRAIYGLPRPENGVLALCGTRTDGGEGKSTLLNALQIGLGGGHMGRVSSDVVTKRGKGKHGPTPEREVVTEKLIAYSEETGGWDICEETLKDFTGGVPISFQAKYGPEVTRPVRASFLISANSLPRLGEDPAMGRRLHVVTFPKPLQPQAAYANAVATKPPDPAVAEAVLARICRAAREHPPELDPLPVPECVSRETTAFVDSIREDFSIWVQNVVTRDENGFLSSDKLWDAWVRHCQAPPATERVGDITRRPALAAFRNVFHAPRAELVSRDGKKLRGWYGYALKPEVLPGE